MEKDGKTNAHARHSLDKVLSMSPPRLCSPDTPTRYLIDEIKSEALEPNRSSLAHDALLLGLDGLLLCTTRATGQSTSVSHQIPSLSYDRDLKSHVLPRSHLSVVASLTAHTLAGSPPPPLGTSWRMARWAASSSGGGRSRHHPSDTISLQRHDMQLVLSIIRTSSRLTSPTHLGTSS